MQKIFSLDVLKRGNNGAGVFKGEAVFDGTRYIHLADGIIVSEDDVKVTGFNTKCEVK